MLRYSGFMIGRPQSSEAAPHSFTYIDLIRDDDPVTALRNQMEQPFAFLQSISEQASLHRYAPEKWSIRQTLNHITDNERIFAYRALWFARGFETPLPGYDQNIGVANAAANNIPWNTHIEEFRRVRLATISLFSNLPPEAWMRRGSVEGNPFTVRAIAYVIAGHFAHHLEVLHKRYL